MPKEKSTLQNLGKGLIEHKRIITTLRNARNLKPFIEKIITKSKTDNTHQRRVVFGHFQDKETVKVLFNEIAPRVADRPGGYTATYKLRDRRKGDNAEMALIELVDFSQRKREA